MVLLSALIHVVLVVYMVTSVRQGQSETRVLQTYTVALVSPEALGLPAPAQPAVSDQEVKPEVVAPQVVTPQVVAPRPQPPPAKKEVAPQKPKATQKEVKPVKSVKAAQKKKKTVKIAAKKETTPKKKAQQKVKAKKPKKEAQPKPPPGQEQASRQKDTHISTQKRDQRILAALEKVRQRVKEAGDQARPAKSTKNSKRGVSGGASSGVARQGDGGGAGPVRGLQFILYTEQVKRRVKQSWIVAELKTGLTVIVRFGIQANGQVFDVEFAQRSGDMAFDESAVRAVRKASPLPPPPVAYRYEFARQKVEVVFGETSRIQ